MLIQNTRTSRQATYKSKGSKGFRQTEETPLSVGLSLSLHSALCDKSLVSNLSTLYLGANYRQILNIEEWIEHAVIGRIEETHRYCLPDFVKKGVNVWFAADNIDVLVDTPFGQDTFHGTLLVLMQRDDNKAQSLNPPLIIPDKVSSQKLEVEVTYKEDPQMIDAPFKFDTFEFGKHAHHLKEVQYYTCTWAFAGYFANTN